MQNLRDLTHKYSPAAAANAPQTGQATPVGINMQAQGTEVHIHQSPANVSINNVMNVQSPDAAPAQTLNATSQALLSATQRGLYDSP